MTAKRRLVPEDEIRALLDLIKSYGVTISGVDVRTDGVTIMTPQTAPGSTPVEMTYAQWKKQNPHHARNSHNQKAA